MFHRVGRVLDAAPQPVQMAVYSSCFLIAISGAYFGLQTLYGNTNQPERTSAAIVPVSPVTAPPTTPTLNQVVSAGDHQMDISKPAAQTVAATKTSTTTSSDTPVQDSTDGSATVAATTSETTDTAVQPELALPTYWNPTSSYNSQLLDSASHVGFVVVDVSSGPGSGAQSNYRTEIDNEESAGIKVYGYIATDSGASSLSTVEAEVNEWYAYYKLNGIFFDQAPGATWTAAQETYYQTLYSFVKAKSGSNVFGTTVVLNTGTTPSQYVMTVSDIVCDYQNAESDYATAAAPSWAAQYPASRFWNIISEAQSSNLQADISLATSRNVGYVYVTPVTGNNPYGQLPSSSFWLAEIADL